MKHNNPILKAGDFWRYSASRYAKGEIAPQAILLQDQHGVNVNVLLLICWCIEHGFIINLPQLNSVISAIEGTEVVLKKQRDARKRARPVDASSQDYAQALAHYNQLKEDELELEKGQQQVMVDAVNSLNVASLPSGAETSMSGVFNASIAALINAYGLREQHQARGLISQILKQL